jgi:hypothetical protein
MEDHDMGFEKREKARKKYEPKKVDWLLVAEAPPEDLNRYFYFETPSTHDDLFRETIHAIYREEFPEFSMKVEPPNKHPYWMPNTRELRKKKPEFLSLFMKDQFHLIDALDTPIPQSVSNHKSAQMVLTGFESLKSRMNELVSVDTRVLLIKSSVCALQKPLREAGFSVMNEGEIHFPTSGQQRQFREEMTKVLTPYFNGRKGKERRSLARCNNALTEEQPVSPFQPRLTAQN